MMVTASVRSAAWVRLCTCLFGRRVASDGGYVADRDMYVTRTHQSPSDGDSQVHFYTHRSTGAIDYGPDDKAIFNGAR